MRAHHTSAPTRAASRGWTDFVESPLGQLAAFVALAAVALCLRPAAGASEQTSLAMVLLGGIALACTAVLAYRDLDRTS